MKNQCCKKTPHECASSSCCQHSRNECRSPSPIDEDGDHAGHHHSKGGCSSRTENEARDRKSHHHDHDHTHGHDHGHNHHEPEKRHLAGIHNHGSQARADDNVSEGSCKVGHTTETQQPEELATLDHDHDNSCCEDDACGSGTKVDHDHDHIHDDGDDSCEDNCGCDSTRKELEPSWDHDHFHNHGAFDRQSTHSHAPLRDRSYLTGNEKDSLSSRVASVVVQQIAIPSYNPIAPEDTKEMGGLKSCNACDPNSAIAHEIQMTRLRVANLCCAGEEKIIRTTLGTMVGVEHIAVNVLGRYVVVKHCAVDCCAPTVKIVDALNAKQLGVSIQEVGHAGYVESEKVDFVQVFHVLIVAALFIAGLVVQLASDLSELFMWFYIVSVILGIIPIVFSSYVTICLRYTIDIHVLLLIAVAGALAAQEYFDASLVVALFIFAELVESLVMMQVRRAINSTASAVPNEAFLSDGRKVKVEDLKTGDIIVVRAGEMILGDGQVLKGDGVVDESALTGESFPIQKRKGSEVFSGTVVQNGFFEVKLTSDFGENTLNKLNQAVMDVQAEQGEYSKIVDRFSVYWTPGILLTAFLVVVVGGAATEDWYLYLYRGLVVLILACPCAIVIATPIPSVCTIVYASKNGVLIKGSSVVERLGSVNAAAMDKTGTLTKGFFKVTDKIRFSPENPSSFDPLQLAASLEQKSTHPLANAIIAEYCGCIAEMAEFELTMPSVRKVNVVEGVGLTGWVEVAGDWKFVAIGNEKMFQTSGGKVDVSGQTLHLYNDFVSKFQGHVIICVAVDDVLEMTLALADEIRPEARDFVSHLDEMKIPVSMITGDHELVARSICTEAGIPTSECFFRLKPNDKLQWVKNKQNQYGDTENNDGVCSTVKQFLSICAKNPRVMMVGDGINDSTALTAASVGVAMGAGGSAMAVTSADVVLMSDNLMLLPSSVKLCRLARGTMIQGFVFAVGIKVVAIVLAILGILQFWHAIVIDLGSLLVVVANGMRPWFSRYYKTNLSE